jgi:hypothetical protein
VCLCNSCSGLRLWIPVLDELTEGNKNSVHIPRGIKVFDEFLDCTRSKKEKGLTVSKPYQNRIKTPSVQAVWVVRRAKSRLPKLLKTKGQDGKEESQKEARHRLHTQEVTGSSPVAPTIFQQLPDLISRV